MFGLLRRGLIKISEYLPARMSMQLRELSFLEFAAVATIALALTLIAHSLVSSWRYNVAVESYNSKLQELQVKIDAIDHNLALREGVILEKDRRIADLTESIKLVDTIYKELEKEAAKNETDVKATRKEYRAVRSGSVVPSRDDADRARRLAELYPD